MDLKREYRPLLWMTGLFLAAYFLPVDDAAFLGAIRDALDLTRWYAREHVILCLLPAFFIAGTIAVFISKEAVIRYLGPAAPKWVAYLTASVSGSVLAVCSCTVLPLFAGIRQRGAGLGPAATFLYAGPAINVLAIILTAQVLGLELGLARVAGAIVFSILIGLIMHALYRSEEMERAAQQLQHGEEDGPKPLWKTSLHFLALVAILVFANWGDPGPDAGLLGSIYELKWMLTGLSAVILAVSLVVSLRLEPRWVALWAGISAGGAFLFHAHPQLPFAISVIALSVILYISPGEPREWLAETWGFTKLILPLLAAGVLVAGFLLGSPGGGGGIVPDAWIAGLVGGESLRANLVASMAGAFMYFATLTEIPILQGLLAGGMGDGPSLALLLAGPAVSLPNMLVIRGVIGTRKTVVFIALVVVMATISGLIYGSIT
ncbi:MAG: permease [bacterium]